MAQLMPAAALIPVQGLGGPKLDDLRYRS